MNRYFEELDVKFEDKIILLDIDGTLTADSELFFEHEVMKRLAEVKEKNTVYLCSNCNDNERKRKTAEILGVRIIDTSKKKPSKSVIAGLNLKGEDCVVIGDKFLIDGLFARNIGACFILVKKKISGKETLKVRFINFIDNLIYKIYECFCKKNTKVLQGL